ncbi:hypothetical protein ACODT5_00770 [Streptomyces sp. 5.8]|uniref:hypothetical protein n=1 Tax=Streptomyces sp. 5.8 TaxID=3406571 RepID=UPI003BB659DF
MPRLPAGEDDGAARRLTHAICTTPGAPPSVAPVEERFFQQDADQVDGLAEALAPWPRVWDWGPALDAARRLKPAGSPTLRAPVL